MKSIGTGRGATERRTEETAVETLGQRPDESTWEASAIEL
jgi:hypothetical protein